MQLNASRIKILQAQIDFGDSIVDNASPKLLSDSLHVTDVVSMNHRSTALDADARLIPPQNNTPWLGIHRRLDKLPINRLLNRVQIKEKEALLDDDRDDGSNRLFVMDFDKSPLGYISTIWKSSEWRGCIIRSTGDLPESNGYLYVESNGGQNQHSTSIGIVVAMAAYIKAILAHFVKSSERDVLAKLLDEKIKDVRHASWFPP